MSTIGKAAAIGVALIAMSLSAVASAHDRYDRRDRHYGHHHKHWHHRHNDRHIVYPPYYAPPYAVRERVVVQRPVYVAPPAPYYYAPAYRPGVVVHVDVPPLVIPIR